MTIRTATAIVPALLLALGLALFQAPAQAGETAMNTAGDRTVDTPAHDADRWGD